MAVIAFKTRERPHLGRDARQSDRVHEDVNLSFYEPEEQTAALWLFLKINS